VTPRSIFVPRTLYPVQPPQVMQFAPGAALAGTVQGGSSSFMDDPIRRGSRASYVALDPARCAMSCRPRGCRLFEYDAARRESRVTAVQATVFAVLTATRYGYRPAFALDVCQASDFKGSHVNMGTHRSNRTQ
jgi:hypothetical protein